MIYVCAIAEYLNILVPYIIETIHPIYNGGVKQWFTTQYYHMIYIYVLAPRTINLFIIGPFLPAFEIVIVKTIAMVASEIAHIGDVKFYFGKIFSCWGHNLEARLAILSTVARA